MVQEKYIFKNIDILKSYFAWALLYFYLVFSFCEEWFTGMLYNPNTGKAIEGEVKESEVYNQVRVLDILI